MNKIFLFASLIGISSFVNGQHTDTSWKKVYREASEKINDLVHTKLEAKFDYSKSRLNGKVWITLKPHFYATDSLTLDAKGMDIKQVAVVKNGKNIPAIYQYDGMFLRIRLDHPYKNSEKYIVFIDYTAKPDEYTGQGSAAITDAKGLYFINPRNEEKNKPTQVWTQGETEGTSVWVPTIDRPNQKTTQEIYMTVPSKYVTLSNGILASQKNNNDGTRTDYWKMDLPHAPYLFFMGIGEFAIIKDKYRDKEVNYYVEKEYAPVAKKIFGNTPEMMAYFSKILGVEYPWQKYSQMVGRDYVSGAMENTTATLHQLTAQQDARQLTDGNVWEYAIAHELFHQWFGDLVTTESWSNLTLNESFANYSEYIWKKYKYGSEEAEAHMYSDMTGYINSGSQEKDLVRFQYADKEDMFDAVSYNKGGCILHMLHNMIGDSAFYTALHLYLTTNQFKSAEAHNLRLAFEEVTGRDLNWFWNQWYYDKGHPKLNITYNYDEATKQVKVIVQQTQASDGAFKLPVKIDIWNGTNPAQYNVMVNNRNDTFSFYSAAKPSLVNFDADKTILAQKTENKTLDEWLFQYRHAKNYTDKRETIDAALQKQDDTTAMDVIMLALHDPYSGIRRYVINRLDLGKPQVKKMAESTLYTIAQNDPDRLTKAAAIGKLGDYKAADYSELFKKAINDSSYTVSGTALEALGKTDSVAAYKETIRLATIPAKGKLNNVIIRNMLMSSDQLSVGAALDKIETLSFGQTKYDAIRSVVEMLNRTKSFDVLKKGVNTILSFLEESPEYLKPQVEKMLVDLQKLKMDNDQKDQAAYIEAKLKQKNQKGF